VTTVTNNLGELTLTKLKVKHVTMATALLLCRMVVAIISLAHWEGNVRTVVPSAKFSHHKELLQV